MFHHSQTQGLRVSSLCRDLQSECTKRINSLRRVGNYQANAMERLSTLRLLFVRKLFGGCLQVRQCYKHYDPSQGHIRNSSLGEFAASQVCTLCEATSE